MRMKYEKICKIGEGAGGQVYKVRRVTDGKIFACKIINDKALAKREIFNLQNVSSEYFPVFYEQIEEENCVYLIEEYIWGQNLKTILKRRKFQEKAAINIIKDLSRGILCLQKMTPPLCYRDIKPENIIIKENGRAAFVDMGAISSMGEIIIGGNLKFTARELMEGKGANLTSDIYSLGKVLDCMLWGKTSKKLRKIIEKATSENVSDRYPDAESFLRAIGGKLSKKDDDLIYEMDIFISGNSLL